MQSYEIRQRFLDFFAKRGHAILPSASLVPENDPSVLFNTAGMQPLVPYLLGQKHPLGTRLASCQKCVRTGDLDDIGDNRHFSFFEMLGNWSLGDYFKEDAIKWSYEFLTKPIDEKDNSKTLELDPNRLYITIFEGDENAPYDEESKNIWMSLGIAEGRIYALPADDNWWSPGDNGPCGPCSEMFYDMEGKFIGQEINKEKFIEEVKNENLIEIWNDVFMEYEKRDGKVIGKLAQKNVDTGAGLERLTAVMQGKKNAYETDILSTVVNKIKEIAEGNYNEINARIITDHIRTSVMLINDNVIPSNKDQGYVLRKLIRRATVKMRNFHNLPLLEDKRSGSVFFEIVSEIYKVYSSSGYLNKSEDIIFEIVFAEEIKFRKTLEQGIKELKKYYNTLIDNVDPENIPKDYNIIGNTINVNGRDIFKIYETYGLPIEISQEIMSEWGVSFHDETMKQAQNAFNEHQKLSQTSSAGMFKGGLANHNEKTIRLHTAHHLLLAGLQEVLGKSVKQRGSNITEERLRMDFAFDRKVTPEELAKVEELVNGWINDALPVVRKEMPLAEAEQLGAEMEFGAKYPDMVSVYMIKNSNDEYVSKEFCGGPHVGNTSELGKFKIQKEEASSAGVRRIKAVLE